MLKLGFFMLPSTIFLIARLPTSAGRLGSSTIAVSSQKERMRSTSPDAAALAHSRLVCINAALSLVRLTVGAPTLLEPELHADITSSRAPQLKRCTRIACDSGSEGSGRLLPYSMRAQDRARTGADR